MNELKPGIYRHYKGGKVRVIFVANHSETLEKFAVYKASMIAGLLEKDQFG